MTEAKRKQDDPNYIPPKIHESRFATAEAKRNVWFITPSEGTEFDEILAPVYWSHVARRLRPGDMIEVVPDENSYKAFLVVIDAGPNWAKVILDRKIELTKPSGRAAGDASDDFSVEWKGPHYKFSVIRKADGQVVEKGFQQRDDAHRWIATNATRMKAA